MQDLLQRWTDLTAEKRLPPDTTFKQWFDYWVSARRGENFSVWMMLWSSMPQPLSFYANNDSGMTDSFPRNAPGMAHDAVQAALAAGVDFKRYDVFGEKMVTALGGLLRHG